MANGIEQAGLGPLMAMGIGSHKVRVAVLDGAVQLEHAGLQGARLQAIGGADALACKDQRSAVCRHGTFVLGVLAATRRSGAPAICPGCSFGIRPLFIEEAAEAGDSPSASAADLAQAIRDSVSWGARVVNISAAVARSSPRADMLLTDALDQAARRGVLVVAAAGNAGLLGATAVTGHRGVIPVVAVDAMGRPAASTNLGLSIGARGLAAPGDGITSLDASGTTMPGAGTSIAAPFVTGAIAMLMSVFPGASSAQVRSALVAGPGRRASVMPALLDASQAFHRLHAMRRENHDRLAHR